MLRARRNANFTSSKRQSSDNVHTFGAKVFSNVIFVFKGKVICVAYDCAMNLFALASKLSQTISPLVYFAD